MKSLPKYKSPLRCKVDDNELVICIGINTLVWAARKRNGGPLDGHVKVVDKLEFAKDVARAICHEDETGNTMLHSMLDKAITDAADRGSCGLSYPRYDQSTKR